VGSPAESAAQGPFLDRLQVPSLPIHSQPAGRVGARGIIQGSARPRHLHVVASTKTLDGVQAGQSPAIIA